MTAAHPLADRRVVVTGAAAGIGAEAVRIASEAGARVVAVDRAAVDLPVERALRADLSDEADLRALPDRIGGDVDVLLNIAGVPPSAGTDLALAVNYMAPRRLTEGLLDAFAAGACVLSIASVGGREWRTHPALMADLLACDGMADLARMRERIGPALGAGYRISKEALIAWSKSMASRVQADRLRINTVSPGPVRTALWDDAATVPGSLGHLFVSHVPTVPRPREIAAAMIALCGPSFAWLSGADIPLDGGLDARLGPASHWDDAR